MDEREETEKNQMGYPCFSPHSSNAYIPLFVGNSYFCDTAPETRSADDTTTFYREDPLWDGMGCGDGNACPPWFSAHLGSSTTDDIEMRLCRDEARLNEDVTAELIEIYV